ncbi:hypothetical protein TNIN_335451 [Trichonephila inaurata madagascariensis]|uniref:Uncharacterized protein n=1 Tax=Trichonephila inaurata madagascariensis TaxID=2747483 RepID=A0A8X7BPZ9_9ARAC|nr:hypothetical protein TNIN_335451 [Trichonephila inaurata madagascariensis]
MEETGSLKTFSPFTLRSNISEPSEQSSESSSVAPLVQGSKYTFYNDNRKQFIIDNADFEEEEKELVEIFNSNSTFTHNNLNFEFFENTSFNEACHFHPISTNASSKEDEEMKEDIDYHTCEDVKENVDYHTDESVNNYKNVNFGATIKGRIKSDSPIFDSQNNTNVFSSGMEETSSLKTFSPFTLTRNISEPSEQCSESSSVAPLVQFSKYVFYDDNEKQFIIENAEFEEEEKELIDTFNSNSTFPHNNPNFEFFENRSFNEACHFYPISTNVSLEDEDVKQNVIYHTDEDVKENIVDSSQKKNIFKKMKSFFRKVGKDKRIGVSYQRFK